ncbi:hypothetical protein AVEN_125162-1 [Araneus ventricosus]|uniref:Uncharacterized protein n=1 Tax=Araneus ventricosus TaxID=182803 RepID=A0A4Y2LUY2_ARAVE|nr:hypothetical protein AVEN_125162-1 [Araneus ventricosus]
MVVGPHATIIMRIKEIKINTIKRENLNSFDTGPSHTSLQARDDSRPKRPNVTLHPFSLSVIDFTPTDRAFFVRVAHPDVLGEEGSFLTIRLMPAVIVVFEGESEFSLSLIEELGRSRILRSLYFDGLRNQRVNPENVTFLGQVVNFISNKEINILDSEEED